MASVKENVLIMRYGQTFHLMNRNNKLSRMSLARGVTKWAPRFQSSNGTSHFNVWQMVVSTKINRPTLRLEIIAKIPGKRKKRGAIITKNVGKKKKTGKTGDYPAGTHSLEADLLLAR